MSEDSFLNLKEKFPMLVSLDELSDLADIEERKNMDVLRDKQGWSFNSELLTLELRKTSNSSLLYDVDLEGINSTAEMLDWIFHIHAKDPCEAHGLVDAFQAVFYPCANCCSWGKEKEFSGSKLARTFAKKFMRGKV